MGLGIWSKLADHRDPRSVASWLRRRRFRDFQQLLDSVPRPYRILDVGGTVGFWDAMTREVVTDLDVTIMNLDAKAASRPGRTVLSGDARDMPFSDGSFEVVFSNSLIEHVGGLEDQRRAASEIQRVGRRWFVQTPNRDFPIEPHFLFPFFQFLPVDARAFLLTRSRLGWRPRAADMEEARRVVEGIRLLRRHELESLFPGSTIREERVLGLVKSLIAVGGWADGLNVR